jgi:hypothetical protein
MAILRHIGFADILLKYFEEGKYFKSCLLQGLVVRCCNHERNDTAQLFLPWAEVKGCIYGISWLVAKTGQFLKDSAPWSK